jgi:hypothetical protein
VLGQQSTARCLVEHLFAQQVRQITPHSRRQLQALVVGLGLRFDVALASRPSVLDKQRRAVLHSLYAAVHDTKGHRCGQYR